MKPRVVLAYSGGLDTSVCVRWLIERGYRVVCFCADVGQEKDMGPARKRAMALGAERVVIRDLREEFAREYVLPALKAGAVYEGKYLLATALSRPLIAKHLADTARQTGAAAVAHGCTGKGNDQVRLEVSLRVLNPRIKVIAPVREWEMKSRTEEYRWLERRKLPAPPKSDSRYSLDQNLWGVSIESGPLEDPWTEPPPEAFRWTKDPARAKAKSEVITVEFAKGVPVRLNGKGGKLTDLIDRLNRIGSAHGIGRSDLIEDRLVGIKSREVYEAPAATILHMAHRELEQLTLDRETLTFKEGVAQRYARMIYDGLWFTPLKTALDAFVERTQERVTGTVRLRLYRGSLSCAGRKSPNSLYARKLATYEAGDLFDQKAAAGFIALWGLPYTGLDRAKIKSKT
ncbi:MAG: argininosuccinate synthase [Candidatus Omnitrophica bacterium]|nr:argininosuccinate synthase [Candidatus Omnitrophota bacterium]